VERRSREALPDLGPALYRIACHFANLRSPPPSWKHGAGTDEHGHDVLSRAFGKPRWRIGLVHVMQPPTAPGSSVLMPRNAS
jgi:hypothetical protein